MRISATLDETAVAALLDELLPVTIDLHPPEPGTRWVRVEKPDGFDFVAGEGVRIRAAATVQWTALGIAIPVTVNSLALMLRPVIVVDEERGGSLVFRPEIESADLKMVPAFVDERIARSINAKLAEEGDLAAWNFAQTLAIRSPLPSNISPAAELHIAAGDAVVQADDTQLSLSLTLTMRFARPPIDK
jgi:hypothetical protein